MKRTLILITVWFAFAVSGFAETTSDTLRRLADRYDYKATIAELLSSLFYWAGENPIPFQMRAAQYREVSAELRYEAALKDGSPLAAQASELEKARTKTDEATVETIISIEPTTQTE